MTRPPHSVPRVSGGRLHQSHTIRSSASRASNSSPARGGHLEAEPICEFPQVDPAALTQSQHHRFTSCGFGVKFLAIPTAGSPASLANPGRHAAVIGLANSVEIRRGTGARIHKTARISSRSDCAGLEAGVGKVRDFVLRIPARRKELHHPSYIDRSSSFGIGRISPLALRDQKAVSGFEERQSIGRNMLHTERDRLLQGLLPMLQRLSRDSEDQVDRHVLKPRLQARTASIAIAPSWSRSSSFSRSASND